MRSSARPGATVVQTLGSVGERILLAFCRDVQTPEYAGGTAKTNIDNALEFIELAVPGFANIVRGKTVLDFGCGHGWQAAALARDYGANVCGLDLPRPVLQSTWKAIEERYRLPNLTLTNKQPDRMFDGLFMQQLRTFRPSGPCPLSHA